MLEYSERWVRHVNDTKHTVENKDSIIGSVKVPLKSRVNARRVIVLGVGLLVVLGIAAWYGVPKVQQTIDNQKAAKAPAPAEYNTLVTSISKDNYSSAISQLDQQLKLAKDDRARGAIYVQQAALALEVQSYDDAVRFAMKAEQLDPTPSTAAVVARCAERKGDKELAIQYYKKAISQLDPKTENGQGDIDIYTRAIKNLGGTI